MNGGKLNISFREISQALKEFVFPEVDLVIGIATGGICPAILIAHQLSKEFRFIHINFRDPSNQPVHETPVVLSAPLENIPPRSRILLVDEVSVSGKTLEVAKALLKDFNVTTFVLKGKADLSLYTDIKSCVNWPWKTN